MSNSIKQAFQELTNQLKANPEQGKNQFSTSSTLKEGVQVTTKARQFTLKNDEPPITGGVDSASNPLEHLIGAFGACQAITYKALASTQNIHLDKVEVKVKAFTDLNGFLGLDKEVRPGYLKVEYETILVSDEEPEKLEALSKKVEQLCPVLDIFANKVKVEGELQLHRKEQLVS